MARITMLVAAAGTLALANPAGGQDPVPDQSALEKVQLAPDVYLFRAPSSLDRWTSSNSVVVVNESDVTVFDANARPATSALVLAEIRKLTNKPVRYLINSHWHMDHWLGNEAYASEFPGLQVIATSETRDYMKRFPVQHFVNSIGVARQRAALDSAMQTGRLRDGSPLTADARRSMEGNLADATKFAGEIAAVTPVFPTLTFTDSLTFWSGNREFRLSSATGDASGSTVLFLPRERILVTGDVLVRQENGMGAPPWTTNSYRITPWLASLKALDALAPTVIVPGQGPALHDREYLRNTIALYEAILTQVHAALEHGTLSLAEVQQKVNLDSIRVRFTNGDAVLDQRFRAVTANLIRKAYQEAHDGVPGTN